MAINVYDVLNAARAEAGYEDRIPEINQDNLANLSQLPPTQLNDFIGVIAKIVKQYVYDTTFDSSDNPFAEFYQEKLPVGASVEDLYVDLITGDVPKWDDDGSYALSRKLPTVAELYHNENYEMQYKVSTSFAQMKSAFLTEGGVNSLINRIKGTLNSSAQYDLFLQCLRLLATAFNHDAFTYRIGFGYESSAQIQTLLRDIKNTVKDFSFMNTKYNYFGFNTKAKSDDIVIITKPDVVSHIDVDYLAGVFNMSKAEIKDRIIYIPDGYGFDGYVYTTDMGAKYKPFMIVCDKRMLRIFPTLMEGGSMYNPASLVDNTFLTIMYIFSYSLFMNALVYCEFVDPDNNSENSTYFDNYSYFRGIISDTSKVEIKSLSSNLDVIVTEGVAEISPKESYDYHNIDGEVFTIKVKNIDDEVAVVTIKNPGDDGPTTTTVEIAPGAEYTASIKYRLVYHYPYEGNTTSMFTTSNDFRVSISSGA